MESSLRLMGSEQTAHTHMLALVCWTGVVLTYLSPNQPPGEVGPDPHQPTKAQGGGQGNLVALKYETLILRSML